MWNAARKADWGIHRAINMAPPENSDCCVYGELSFCDIMAERCQLGLLDPNDDFLFMLAATTDYVKRRVSVMKASQLRATRFIEKQFVKPVNDKVFQRGVYRFSGDVPLRYVDDDCPCLVSEVVDFETEIRLYCLDGKVVTSASYMLIGDRAEDVEISEAHDFGDEVLRVSSDWLPSAVVLDVGRITGRGWAVVEANQAYASGIYGGADTNAILDVIYRSAGPLTNVSESDKKFIRW